MPRNSDSPVTPTPATPDPAAVAAGIIETPKPQSIIALEQRLGGTFEPIYATTK